MNQNDLILKFENLQPKVKLALNDAAIISGKRAVDLFKENFQKEGFMDGALQPWKEVQRRQNPKIKGARASRKILTGDTGDLGESIRYENLGNGSVRIYSDKPYAEAQNEGTTTAGRNRNVVIPARKFMGESQQLNDFVKAEIDRKMKNLFK